MKFIKKDDSIIMQQQESYCGYADEILDAKFLDENNILVCTNSESIKIFNTSSNKVDMIFGHKDIVTSCALFNDLLVTGSKDGHLKTWRIS